MPSNHPILCRSLLLLPSIFPSIRVFSSKLVHQIMWPKFFSTQLSLQTNSHIHTWLEKPYSDYIDLVGKVSLAQFSRSVVSDSLRPHGLQHARLPCPSPSPGAYSNSHTLSWWCHPTIPSSVVPFFSCLQSSPASASFLMSQFFASGGQSVGASASASVLPVNIQD